MSIEFAGRVAVVAGSSKGIGRATATLLARAGARVVVNARHADALVDVAAELERDGHDVLAVPGNVTRPGGAESLIAAPSTTSASRRRGQHGRRQHDVRLAPRRRAGGLRGDNPAQHVADGDAGAVRGRPRPRRGRRDLVAVSAIGSHSIQPEVAPYCASKAALEVLVRCLANELGPRGIRVNAVAPGLVATDMSRALWEGEQEEREAALLPLGRLGQPDDIAGAIRFLLSDDAAWTTGQVIDVDGGCAGWPRSRPAARRRELGDPTQATT